MAGYGRRGLAPVPVHQKVPLKPKLTPNTKVGEIEVGDHVEFIDGNVHWVVRAIDELIGGTVAYRLVSGQTGYKRDAFASQIRLYAKGEH